MSDRYAFPLPLYKPALIRVKSVHQRNNSPLENTSKRHMINGNGRHFSDKACTRSNKFCPNTKCRHLIRGVCMGARCGYKLLKLNYFVVIRSVYAKCTSSFARKLQTSKKGTRSGVL